MSKKIILTIALILVFIFTFSIAAYATNISLIKPDYPDTIVLAFPETTGVIIYPSGVRQYFTTPSTQTPVYYEPIEEEEVIEQQEEEITTTEEPPVNYDELIKDIFALVNQARMDAELEPLTYNLDLQDAANVRAREITELFSHTRPDGHEFGSAIKLDYRVAGENLIMADDEIASAEELMDTWMNSEGHRANILSPYYTSMAIGLCRSDGVTYVVQLFLKMA